MFTEDLIQVWIDYKRAREIDYVRQRPGIIPINVDGRANVKIAGSEEEGLSNAIERFLGKNPLEIAQVARETVDGSLRGVLATVTPEEARVLVNRKRFEADVVVPADADRKTSELRAIGESARILESGRATAEAIRMMREQWQNGDARELFLIQMLPDLLDKVTRVAADNLHIEKLTVLESGNGNGLPAHVRNLTNSAIVVLEQLKNSVGLDIPGLLETTVTRNSAELPRE